MGERHSPHRSSVAQWDLSSLLPSAGAQLDAGFSPPQGSSIRLLGRSARALVAQNPLPDEKHMQDSHRSVSLANPAG